MIIETDVILRCTYEMNFIAYANEIMGWCFDRGIEADYVGCSFYTDVIRSVWRLDNEVHRTMFILRWQ